MVLWVGVGCSKGTPKQVIELGIQTIFQAHHLSEAAIAGIATIDLKAEEIGLLELCRDRNFRLRCFPAEQLRLIPVPNSSASVTTLIATGSVAEAAALLAASTADRRKDEQPSAMAAQLLVSKQIFRLNSSSGVVTIAIAQSKDPSALPFPTLS